MKARITFWVALVALTMAVGIIVQLHRSSVAKVEVKNQKLSSTDVAQTPSKITIRKTASILPQQIPEQLLTSDIQAIVNSKANYQQRLEVIQSLNGKLEGADKEALFAFLRSHDANDEKQLGQVFKNKLLDALCELQPPPQGLRELLTQMYEDPNQSIVLRDYALQHLTAFYQQMAQAQNMDPDVKADELKQTRQTLWDALTQTDSSMAGTALLGLTHLSQQDFDGFDQSKIGNKALDLAQQNANELTHITALQVCATLNVQDSLTIVLGAAQAGETESVKISAIGALGLLGNKDQIPFLNSVLSGKDERLKVPAQQALNSINRRLAQITGTKAS